MKWLVDGLITINGHAAVGGKPKASKSTVVRNLIACVIKGRAFLGRDICIPAGTGRVLYLHLDRKDDINRVAEQLRNLGITEAEADRLILTTEVHMPDKPEARLAWLAKQVMEFKPHLVVIDLLMQFLVLRTNEYDSVLAGINSLQDTLSKAGYAGALVCTFHARKATNPNEAFDDFLGSTGFRASFSTGIMLKLYRAERIYTIESDQTDRDDFYGDMPETVITRGADGVLALGQQYGQIAQAQKQSKAETEVIRLYDFIHAHPGVGIADIIEGMGVSKPTAIKLLATARELIRTEGEGVKGDAFRYFAKEFNTGQATASIPAATAEVEAMIHAN